MAAIPFAGLSVFSGLSELGCAVAGATAIGTGMALAKKKKSNIEKKPRFVESPKKKEKLRFVKNDNKPPSMNQKPIKIKIEIEDENKYGIY